MQHTSDSALGMSFQRPGCPGHLRTAGSAVAALLPDFTNELGEDEPSPWRSSRTAVNTIFLPRKLPQFADSCDDKQRFNFGHPGTLAEFAQLCKAILPRRACGMIRRWDDHYYLDVASLKLCCNNLAVGDTLPIHLVAQNAAVTLTRASKDQVVIRAYEIQHGLQLTTETEGAISSSMPHSSARASTELVFSEEFLTQLQALQSFFRAALVKTGRRGGYQEEPREASKANYVLEWMMSFLTALGSPDETSLAMKKKVRDSVQFSETKHEDKQPWRRQAAWMAFKYVLHMSLVNDAQCVTTGTLQYKMAMLHYMTSFVGLPSHQHDRDLMQQMLAKVSQRVQKLHALLGKPDLAVASSLRSQIQQVLDESADAVQRVHQHQCSKWNKEVGNIFARGCPQLSEPVDSSTQLALPSAMERLSAMRQEHQVPYAKQSARKPRHATRLALERLAAGGTSFTEVQQLTGIHDFEENILELWSERDSRRFKCNELLAWMKHYAKATQTVAKCKDPIGQSRRLLVGAVLAVLVDKETTTVCPLLHDHLPHIDVEPLNSILANNKQMLTVVTELQQYIRGRQTNAIFQTGPLETGVSDNSISARYARKDATMLRELQRMIEADNRSKEVHLQQVRRQLENFQQEWRATTNMECITSFFSKKAQVWRNEHSSYHCSKCKQQRELQKRMQDVFEEQLPSDRAKQLAVIFEARLPTAIGVWRDTVYVYNKEIVRHLSDLKESRQHKPVLWRDDLCTTGHSSTVALGSHRNRIKVTNDKQKELIYNSPEDFVTCCQLDCNLFAEDEEIQTIQPQPERNADCCTWKVNNSTLQRYVNNCDHQQSQVLAARSECPSSLSPVDFITFGSLRAGERLQWFNILRGIHRRTLLLHKLEIAQLVAQAIWQAGNVDLDGVCGNFLRNAHQPCGTPEFVADMTRELNTILQGARDNWKNQWTLFSVVILANRLLDIATTDRHEEQGNGMLILDLKRILQLCRDIAETWLRSINEQKRDEVNPDNVASLRCIAGDIATFGALTFTHGAELIEPTEGQSRVLHQWLRFITEMRSNLEADKHSMNKDLNSAMFSEQIRNLVPRVAFDRHRDIIELLSHGTVQEDGVITHPELVRYMKETYCPGKFGGLDIHSGDQLWITVTWITTQGSDEKIEIDLRQGDFWVNGYPQTHLPDQVTENDLFKRHFPGLAFSVKPYTSPRGEKANITEKQVCGSQFVFASVRKLHGADTVTIYEVEDGDDAHMDDTGPSSLLLLSRDWFKSGENGDIPTTLRDQYSHWLDIQSGCVYFRHVSVASVKFHNARESDFVLQLDDGKLKATEYAPAGIEANSHLLSPKSVPGCAILETLSGLELAEYIELWRQTSGDVLARLPRLGLSFIKKKDSVSLCSLDHKGWSVDPNQTIGTLLGMVSGLVLKNGHRDQLEQRCIIMPHGEISTGPGDFDSWPRGETKIVLKNLNTPPCFRYEVDKVLKQLKGPMNVTAWLYLAALHAHTSSVFADPFTGLTGMESAMNILQSARCWSSVPMEAESVKILQAIRHLSPKRSFYPSSGKPCMEVVTWPRDFDARSLCASDAYAIVVDEIFAHHEKLGFLYASSDKKKGIAASTGKKKAAVQRTQRLRGPGLDSNDCGYLDFNSPAVESDTDEELSLRFRNLSMKGSRGNGTEPKLLTRKAYCRSSCSYPVMARLKNQHLPASQLVPVSTSLNLSDVTIRAVRSVINKVSPELSVSPLQLETNLLNFEYDDEVIAHDGQEVRYSEDLGTIDLDTLALLSLPRSFLSLHAFVNEHKDESRLRIALMLSFLAFHLESSSRQSRSPETVLVNVLIACASTSDSVPPPTCRMYPAERTTLPRPRQLAKLFSQPLDAFFTDHGIDVTRRYQYLYNATDERALTVLYEKEQAVIQDILERDVSCGQEALSSQEYNHVSPCLTTPSIVHEEVPYSSFKSEEYRLHFHEVMKKVHASENLTRYTQRVAVSCKDLDVYENAEAQLGRPSLVGEFAFESITTTIEYELSPIVTTGLQSVPVYPNSEDLPTRAEAVPQPNATPLPLLLKSLRSQGMEDPVVEDFADDLEKSISLLQSKLCSIPSSDGAGSAEVNYTRNSHTRSFIFDKGWKKLTTAIATNRNSNAGTRALHACGLLKRCHPLVLFSTVVAHKVVESEQIECIVEERFSDKARSAITELAKIQVYAQRSLRLLRYALEKQTDLFAKEAASAPHRAWEPKDHPEWLIFEIENDLCIWPKQVDMANHMMNPVDGKHSVMQLNMGEGKTSVIMPIIAAELADGGSLVRLVVLTSLLKTNCNQLIFKLGGMLNRRVLTLPFRRDFHLTSGQASTIVDTVQRCQKDFGIVVTVREHLLSLQLKFFEACGQKDTATAKCLGKLYEMLDCCARDVIDEADEVLHHRFQLVYPMGNYASPDGGELRWQAAQIVLDCAKGCAEELSGLYGSSVDYSPQLSQEFPGLRILNASSHREAYSWLCGRIATKVLCGASSHFGTEFMDEIGKLSRIDREWLRNFLISKDLPQRDVDRFNIVCPPSVQKHLLCLRGLLAHEILLLGLQKRYRVEYGLLATTNQLASSSQRQIRMAVPFRAKDVAADRTEFGHIDVAIVLTLLSYYKHGLTNSQIEEVFDRLSRKDKSSQNAIYASWVEVADDVNASVSSLDGINRKDKGMMERLVYPFLCRHMMCIDFYVEQFIFVHEVKEFPNKLVGNAWSMTPEKRAKPVTGFSGTNDTHHLLPGSTAQRDLPQLQYTNAHVCNLVLAPENDSYTVTPSPCTGNELLKQISQPQVKLRNARPDKANTLIDVGAMILDLRNEEVARTWLDLRTDKQAVVFFDNENQLRVLDRLNREPGKLELSPYSNDLADCLVYLDHAHTRGTDLRMTKGTRAAVTLGKGLRRDELVQACMRMRQLGNGHKLSFWAPKEVDLLIREQLNLEPAAKGVQTIQHLHVLQWCFFNSIQATKEGFMSWATQGLAYLHVSTAITSALHNGRLSSSTAVSWLKERCLLPDCVSLENMYGRTRGEQCVADIIAARSGPGAGHLVSACKRFVPAVRRYAQTLDEEQERELEQEIEEERQKEKLPSVQHISEECPKYLVQLVRRGDVEILSGDGCSAVPLWQCLLKTSVADKHGAVLNSDAWNTIYLHATKSFANTVHPPTASRHGRHSRSFGRGKSRSAATSLAKPSTIDSFLRPVEWVLVIRPARAHPYMLVLSPFEANSLLAVDNWHAAASLHVYASTVHPRQGIISDWRSTACGPPLPLTVLTDKAFGALFAELLCFSGGLFFGRNESEVKDTMISLGQLLQVSPGPDEEDTERPVTWKGDNAPSQDPSAAAVPFCADPLPLVYTLMKLLHSSESIGVSHMGRLLLQHCWPTCQEQ